MEDDAAELNDMQRKLTMKMKRFIWVSLLAAFFVALGTPVWAQNKVVPITAEEIKQMIESKDCPLLLVATAAWCAPCRAELPILNKFHIKYKDQGLKIVAISLDVAPENMQLLVDKLDLKFPVYWGGEKMAYEYNIFGVPTILVVKNGKIEERIIGKRSESFLEEKIVQWIKKCTMK
jgi:thiol-disulfide isomerase/thioredoxin